MRRSKSGLPRYCSYNTDRGGTRRVRFRLRGFSTYLTGTPWSEDFMRQYAAALDGVKGHAAALGRARLVAGSVNELVAAYLDCSEQGSSSFKVARPLTQRTRRYFSERFRETDGDVALTRVANGKRVMLLERRHVQIMVNRKAATPSSQRGFLQALRALFKWAVSEGRVPADPTEGVTRVKVKSAGFKTWSNADIAKFEAVHAVGTKGRLAFDLPLFTGQRLGDIISMGPQHVRDGVLSIVQEKTGAAVDVPLHPKLAASIAATPSGHLSFLVTVLGRPYDRGSFGNWFRKLCDEAGCRGLSAHGLRKAAGTRLAAIGCTTHEIAAILGHASLAMVELYTRAANRKELSRTAMLKLVESEK
jgi:integrase